MEDVMENIRCLGCLNEFSEEFDICPFCGYTVGTPAKEAYHIKPGSLIHNRYLMGRVLGYGGFGVTYIGWDILLEQRVAIKEYLPSEFATRMPGNTDITVYSGEGEEQFISGMKSFVDEARRLALFNDVYGIVRIFDSFSDNNTAYIVMEYLEGKTVKTILNEKGKLSFEETTEFILPVLNALEQVHKAGIVHRDISPDNIFVTDSGEVKLLDFGASRYATTLHSKSLSVILKAGYAPEEQYRSRGNQGPWSDIYAVGATMYKMLTGQVPEEALERAAKDTLKEPSKLGVAIPVAAENALMNSLNVHSENRIQNANELAEALNGTITPERKKEAKVRQDVGRWPLWLKVVSASCVALLVTLTILFGTGVINLKAGALLIANIGQNVPKGQLNAPGVVNMTVDNAEKIITGNKLILQITDKQYSETTPKDKIMTQNPLPGRLLSTGSKIEVVVSAGAETVYVPDVVDYTKDVAVQRLKSVGLNVITSEKNDDITAPGAVISQSVPPQTAVDKGSSVQIYISKGPQNPIVKMGVKIPDVAGKSFGDAKQLLNSMGLYIVHGNENYSSTVAVGLVEQQSPAKDADAQTGDTVSVDISLGVQQVHVPDVQYQDEATARTTLSGLGLVASVTYKSSTTVKSGNVISQDQAAGTLVNVGATVAIYVSTGSSSSKAPSSKPTNASSSKPASSSTGPGAWSDWVTALPAGVTSANYDIQQKTQYQYRDKQTTSSTSGSLAGWTQYNTTSAWGGWSGWSTNAVSASGTRQVNTQQVADPQQYKTVYNYNRWVYVNGSTYYSFVSGYGGFSGHWEYIQTNSPLQDFGNNYGRDNYGDYGTVAPRLWFNQSTSQVALPLTYHTEYQYCDLYYTYYYYQWGGWSAWQDAAVSATSDRQVNTRALYQYRTK
jgi:beta-lactam-binding protein with PASTA domain/serine/threonine protein kinase